jgi:hypothetical protein
MVVFGSKPKEMESFRISWNFAPFKNKHAAAIVGHLNFSADRLCIPQYIGESQFFNPTYSILVPGPWFLVAGESSLKFSD